jgi:hypothetical protein
MHWINYFVAYGKHNFPPPRLPAGGTPAYRQNLPPPEPGSIEREFIAQKMGSTAAGRQMAIKRILSEIVRIKANAETECYGLAALRLQF